jgi:hypothetical protein
LQAQRTPRHTWQVSSRLRPPFTTWPVQAFDAAFGHVWFAHPAIVATQSCITHADVAWAAYIHDRIDQVLEHAAAEIEAHSGLLFIHDFRSIVSYDAEARLAFLDRMRRRRTGYSRGSIVAIRTDQPLLRMGIQAANMLSAVALKVPLSMVVDPRDAVASEVQQPPAPDERFPGESAPRFSRPPFRGA